MKETRKTYQESAEEYADSFFDFPCSVFSLFDELLALHDKAELLNPDEGTNNYEVNVLIIQVKDDNTLIVETAYRDEYGTVYGNNDHKRINKQYRCADNTRYVCRYIILGNYFHLYEDDHIVAFE